MRNQIDYIIMRNENRRFVTNSRSYGGIATETDHKLVKAEINFEWYRIKMKNEKAQRKIDIKGFADKNKQMEYYEEVRNNVNRIACQKRSQEKWNEICKVCTEAGERVLGRVRHTKRYHDNELEQKSKVLRELRLDIESCQNSQKREMMTKKKKDLKSGIKKKIKQIEEQQLERRLKRIEDMKNDSARCFEATKEMNNSKKQKPLIIKNDKGEMASSEEEQIKIISDHFNKMLAPKSQEGNFKEYAPQRMRQPFTEGEINKAARSLKNGKSAGPDDIHAELSKYAPLEIHREIAEIFNKVAESGENIMALTLGFLRPLQKPGKQRGPVVNLRPIILLSILGKILTICFIRRTWNRLEKHIPSEQSAYQPGRSTTEQVFAVKTLPEKAIISNDYKVYLLLLDMSKAFDTVDRKKLFEELDDMLEGDELHLLSKITNQPELKVKLRNTLGESFKTNTGIM